MPPEKVFKIYELARSGLARSNVAAVLGVGQGVLSRWERAYPAVKAAVELGHRISDPEGRAEAEVEYFYGRLSAKTRGVWDKLTEIYEKDLPDSCREAEALLLANPRQVRQELFLQAFVKFNFNKTEARKFARVSKKTLDQWSMSENFRRLMAELKTAKKDFYESAMVQLVREGNPAAVIHANKTVNRDRGYGDKVVHEVSGQVTHRQAVGLDDILNLLDQATKLKILEAVRKVAAGETEPEVRQLPAHTESDEDIPEAEVVT
jgi:hypothetical protein